MTTLEWIGLIIAVILGAFTALARVYKWGSFTDLDYLPSVEPEKPDTVDYTIPTVNIIPAPQPLLWATPQQAWHSVRVLCDEMGLTYDQKNEICYTIWGESEFHIGAIGKPNKNGTRDYGICQFNDGKNAKGIPFWIGEGATFKDINEVLTNPEKCVRVMIQTYKVGHIGWWYGHKGYSLAAVDSSPMWKLRVV